MASRGLRSQPEVMWRRFRGRRSVLPPAETIGRWTPVRPKLIAAVVFLPVLWATGRRVFPRLLPAVDGEVHERVAVVHRLLLFLLLRRVERLADHFGARLPLVVGLLGTDIGGTYWAKA